MSKFTSMGAVHLESLRLDPPYFTRFPAGVVSLCLRILQQPYTLAESPGFFSDEWILAPLREVVYFTLGLKTH